MMKDFICFNDGSIHNNILSKYAGNDKNVVIPAEMKIGFDRAEDERRGFYVSKGGITVVPKGAII
mgnify:CR=1 FL=1